MAIFYLDNVRLFAGGVDFTTRSNKVELAIDYEEKDATNFGSGGWKEVLGGLAASALGAEGQWEAGDAGKVDDQAFAALGSVGGWTVCPDAAAVGDLAYLSQALRAQYKLGGQVGDIAPWSGAWAGAWPVARGVVAHPPGTARTATGTGTAIQLGAVTADKYIYATLHVLSIAGTSTPTITVKIQSDDNSGFSSATDRITFTGVTDVIGVSGQISRLAGAVTDDYWRAQWTISGTDPSFLFVVAFGIK